MKRILVLALVFAFVFQSCKEKDPLEGVPSFVRVDEAVIDITDPSQGSAVHNISDCWLYAVGENEDKLNLIGVFEIPFEVPVLSTGKVHIEIEPGIKTSGLDADREVYSMMTNYTIDTVLPPNTTVKITPHYSYRNGVEFIMVENFDQIGTKFETADSSTYSFSTVQEGALEGYSMMVEIPKDDYSGHFECRTSDVYSISEKGVTFLEMSYKCNDLFNFGMFGVVESATSTTGVRENVMTLYPTNDKWKRIYINLNYAIANTSSNCGQFQPFFTAVRVDSLSPVGQNSKIFIDNIKLLHVETQSK
ncbi:MAG: hypothetical protein J6W06_09330 [Bacteroidales bacterium]|nr:hypothetical protein [Bacteroidales bacterium]